MKKIISFLYIKAEKESKNKPKSSLSGIISQIVILDIVFSLDSVITAVGLTDNQWIIITAVICSLLQS